MIRFSLAIRSVALLRRIAMALEERNRIERERFQMEYAPRRPEIPRRSRVREVFTPSVEQRNELWRENLDQ